MWRHSTAKVSLKFNFRSNSVVGNEMNFEAKAIFYQQNYNFVGLSCLDVDESLGYEICLMM